MERAAQGPGPETRPRTKFPRKILVVALLLSLGLGYFVYAAFQSSTVYYLTVSELVEGAARPSGRMVRVAGKLVPDSFQRDLQSPMARFAIADGSRSLQVAYRGVLPDLFFNNQSDIVVEGSYGPGGTFNAENVIVKCPSKYEGPPNS